MAEENDFSPQDFEGDDAEKLRLENELLKLKMQAELGAFFEAMPGMELSPELENEFLKQVQSFHQQQADNPPVPLRDYLDMPVMKPAAELSETELAQAWERLSRCYEEKGIGVDFLAEYPLSVRYDFMAGELLSREVTPMPGWRFIYEDFHPNHDYDQRQRTEEFMQAFFGGVLNEFCVADSLLTDDGRQVPRAEAQQLLERFHSLFAGITDWDFQIHGSSAQSDGEMENDIRLGFTEGLIRYTVQHPDGTSQEIMGPFKLYMECVYDWWQVMHFYMHGFSWK